MLGATVRFGYLGRTANSAIRTENAAVAGNRPEQSLAGFAFVEKNARVRWHLFFLRQVAIRTSDSR